MRNWNKLLAALLCGAATASAVLNSTSYAVNMEIFTGTLKKSSSLRTCYMHQYKYYDSSSRKAIYDMYVKVDSQTFELGETPTIFQKTDEIITGVSARLNNSDGSYIYADVIGFEPAQMDYMNLAFPINGNYICNVNASTDVTAEFTIEVTNASSPYNSADKTSPQIVVTVPDISQYVPGKGITVNIETNELCNIEIEGKNYYKCNGVNHKITSDGTYIVNAVDINGNPTSASFTVDIINKATTTTTTTTTTATTTTTTTTTATTIKPEPVAMLYGDANMDSQITMADAAAIFQCIGNPDKYHLSSAGSANADCFNPGSGITVNDAITIQKYSAKIVASLPVMQ